MIEYKDGFCFLIQKSTPAFPASRIGCVRETKRFLSQRDYYQAVL